MLKELSELCVVHCQDHTRELTKHLLGARLVLISTQKPRYYLYIPYPQICLARCCVTRNLNSYIRFIVPALNLKSYGTFK
jgi:hypothetical protein